MEEMTPGNISWHEMMSVDVEASKRFYRGLFEWSYELRQGDSKPYYVVHDGSRRAGGITESPIRAPFPKWVFYVTVADVDVTTEKARTLGAEIQLEPWDVHGIGRAAVIMDPFGASFGIISYADASEIDDDVQFRVTPPSVKREAGQFCWQTLNIQTRESAARFYHELFGWTTMFIEQDDGRQIWFLANERRPIATIATIRTGDETLPNWDISIAVPDIEVAIQAVIDDGGSVLKRAFPIEGMGVSAIVRDPSNASFSIFQIEGDQMARTLAEVRDA